MYMSQSMGPVHSSSCGALLRFQEAICDDFESDLQQSFRIIRLDEHLVGPAFLASA